MKILLAKNSGFCEGVERAFNLALGASTKNAPVYMLGNLVHNKQVVENLTQNGIRVVHDLSEIPNHATGTLLISAHGVSPEIIEKSKTLGLNIMDTTCPWVKKAQKLAQKLALAGYFVVIIGDAGHPEVKGLKGWAGTHSAIVDSPAATTKIALHKKIGVVSQTTQSQKNFDAIVKILKAKGSELAIHNTICGATAKRQDSATTLAKKVDRMLVIGDKMSANTKRLTELSKLAGARTNQIQTASELKPQWFKNIKSVGITAGASTPHWVIEEIRQKILDWWA